MQGPPMTYFLQRLRVKCTVSRKKVLPRLKDLRSGGGFTQPRKNIFLGLCITGNMLSMSWGLTYSKIKDAVRVH